MIFPSQSYETGTPSNKRSQSDPGPRRTVEKIVALALLGIGLVEAGVIGIALSPESQADVALLLLTFGLLFSILAQSVVEGRGLLRRKRDPHRTRLLLDAIYWLSAMLNGVVLYAMFLYSLRGSYLPVWPFWVGISIIMAVLSNFFLMQALGQGYEFLRYDSWKGATAFAYLARRRLGTRNREALSHLIVSVNMARRIFYARSFVPVGIDAVCATLSTMSEAGSAEPEKLSTLATSLEKLPNPDTLPSSFQIFLDALEWPLEFKWTPPPRKRSGYPRLSLLLAVVASMTALIALLAESKREAFVESFGGFVIQYASALIGTTVFLLAAFMVIRRLAHPIPIIVLLRHWPKEDV